MEKQTKERRHRWLPALVLATAVLLGISVFVLREAVPSGAAKSYFARSNDIASILSVMARVPSFEENKVAVQTNELGEKTHVFENRYFGLAIREADQMVESFSRADLYDVLQWQEPEPLFGGYIRFYHFTDEKLAQLEDRQPRPPSRAEADMRTRADQIITAMRAPRRTDMSITGRWFPNVMVPAYDGQLKAWRFDWNRSVGTNWLWGEWIQVLLDDESGELMDYWNTVRDEDYVVDQRPVVPAHSIKPKVLEILRIAEANTLKAGDGLIPHQAAEPLLVAVSPRRQTVEEVNSQSPAKLLKGRRVVPLAWLVPVFPAASNRLPVHEVPISETGHFHYQWLLWNAHTGELMRDANL